MTLSTDRLQLSRSALFAQRAAELTQKLADTPLADSSERERLARGIAGYRNAADHYLAERPAPPRRSPGGDRPADWRVVADTTVQHAALHQTDAWSGSGTLALLPADTLRRLLSTTSKSAAEHVAGALAHRGEVSAADFRGAPSSRVRNVLASGLRLTPEQVVPLYLEERSARIRETLAHHLKGLGLEALVDLQRQSGRNWSELRPALRGVDPKELLGLVDQLYGKISDFELRQLIECVSQVEVAEVSVRRAFAPPELWHSWSALLARSAPEQALDLFADWAAKLDGAWRHTEDWVDTLTGLRNAGKLDQAEVRLLLQSSLPPEARRTLAAAVTCDADEFLGLARVTRGAHHFDVTGEPSELAAAYSKAESLRDRAALALRLSGSAPDLLVELFEGEPMTEVRVVLASLLSGAREDKLASLIAQEPSVGVRRMLVGALARKGVAAEPFLVELLSDGEPRIALDAAIGLKALPPAGDVYETA